MCWPNNFDVNHICYCEKHFIFRMQFNINDLCVRACVYAQKRYQKLCALSFVHCLSLSEKKRIKGNRKNRYIYSGDCAAHEKEEWPRTQNKEPASIVLIWMQSVVDDVVFFCVGIINGKVIKTEKVSMEMEMILHRKIGYYLNFNLHKIISSRAFATHRRAETHVECILCSWFTLLSLFMMAIW